MKKRMHQLILTSMLVFMAFNSHAANNTDRKDDETMKAKIAAMTEQQKEARYEEIKARVEEIKNMDKSTLTKTERKDLKKELRGMQKEAKALEGGVYISLAGIVIIILLLILIL